MDTTPPPTEYAYCGQHINPAVEPWKAAEAEDKDTGEPVGFPGKVVHENCWPAWAEANGIK